MQGGCLPKASSVPRVTSRKAGDFFAEREQIPGVPEPVPDIPLGAEPVPQWHALRSGDAVPAIRTKEVVMFAPYLVVTGGLLLSGLSALVWIRWVTHLDPPEVCHVE